MKARGVPSRYVEDLSDATCLRETLRRRQGTKLADFFSILLDGDGNGLNYIENHAFSLFETLGPHPMGPIAVVSCQG